MPPRILMNTANVGLSSEASLIRFPTLGRASGRIDSILLSLSYQAAFPGISWAQASELRIYLDDPGAAPVASTLLSFADAWRWSETQLDTIHWQGDATHDWAFAIFHPGLFQYFFDVRAYNADGAAAHSFHATVMFEEF